MSDHIAAKPRAKRTIPLDVSLADTLISEIIAAQHPPGSWLREQDIAARFGVSRSPVREALRHVAKAGFVEMRPWRGAQVIEMSAADTRHVFDLLEAIYGVTARIAAETIPTERMKALNTFLERCEAAVRTGTRDEQVAAAFDFGRYLARWSASPMAYEMVIYAGRLAMWQQSYLLPEDRVTAERSLEIHRALKSAVEARDGDAAEWAARTIVALTKRSLTPVLARGSRTS